MGKRYSGQRPEDQPMYVKPNQLDFEKRSLLVTSVSTTFKKVIWSITSFLKLNDTPASYSGQANKVVKVNSGETALTFGMTESEVYKDMIFDGGTTDDNLDSTSIVVLDLGGI